MDTINSHKYRVSSREREKSEEGRPEQRRRRGRRQHRECRRSRLATEWSRWSRPTSWKIELQGPPRASSPAAFSSFLPSWSSSSERASSTRKSQTLVRERSPRKKRAKNWRCARNKHEIKATQGKGRESSTRQSEREGDRAFVFWGILLFGRSHLRFQLPRMGREGRVVGALNFLWKGCSFFFCYTTTLHFTSEVNASSFRLLFCTFWLLHDASSGCTFLAKAS